MQRKTVLIKVRKNFEKNINDELRWFGRSLGLFGLRDRNSSCFRVFITLLKRAKQNEPLSSDDIAERLRLSRGTVVHHLNKLMSAGLIIKQNRGYILREHNLQRVVDDIKHDIDATLADLQAVARELDEQLSL
jgi:predicted transcriptional regulator